MASPLIGTTDLTAGISNSQAVTIYNENRRVAESISNYRVPVGDINRNAPPAAPLVEGRVYLIGSSPTGAWSGLPGRVAVVVGGGWQVLTPSESLFVQTDSGPYRRNIATNNWVALPGIVAGFTNTTAAYTQPALNDDVVIEVDSNSFFAVGQAIIVEGAGVYEILDKPTPQELEIKLLEATISPTNNVSLGRLVVGTGLPGEEGAPGSFVGLRYEYTTDSPPPTSGQVTIDSGTLYIHKENVDSVDFSDYFEATPTGSVIILGSEADTEVYNVLQITGGFVENTDVYSVAVVSLGSNGTLADEEIIRVNISIKGEQGDEGIQGDTGFDGGFQLLYEFDDATTDTPTASQVRYNNVTLGSVTQVYLNVTGTDSLDYEEILDAVSLGSILQLKNRDAANNLHYWLITSKSKSGGVVSLGVTPITNLGGVFGDGDNVSLAFSVQGEQGDPGVLTNAGGVILEWVAVPPSTGAEETAIFVDSADGKLYQRDENDGAIKEIGGRSVVEKIILSNGL